MSRFIRLGSRKPVLTYGEFLITVDGGGSYAFYDTKNNCPIYPPYLADNVPWCGLKIHDDVVILTAFPERLPVEKAAPTSGYKRGVSCVFLKSRGVFLINPDGNSDVDVIFDKVAIEDCMIWCRVKSYDKTTSEYWFDFEGTWKATIQHNPKDKFYTVEIQNGEKIDRVCEVQTVEDTKTHEVTGLHIICLTKDETEVNLFYPF